jgi:hypothetical protein
MVKFGKSGYSMATSKKTFVSNYSQNDGRRSTTVKYMRIPQVYWKGAFPISSWGGGERPPGDDDIVKDWDDDSQASSNRQSEEERIYYGIVMEYFDDFREVDYSKLDLQTAEAVARALCRVHEARIRHGDIAERNILLVRKLGIVRAVWIDYSCSWINAYGSTLDAEWGAFMEEFYEYAVTTTLHHTDFARTVMSSQTKSFRDLKHCDNHEYGTTEQTPRRPNARRYPTISSPNLTVFALHTSHFAGCNVSSYYSYP